MVIGAYRSIRGRLRENARLLWHTASRGRTSCWFDPAMTRVPPRAATSACIRLADRDGCPHSDPPHFATPG